MPLPGMRLSLKTLHKYYRVWPALQVWTGQYPYNTHHGPAGVSLTTVQAMLLRKASGNLVWSLITLTEQNYFPAVLSSLLADKYIQERYVAVPVRPVICVSIYQNYCALPDLSSQTDAFVLLHHVPGSRHLLLNGCEHPYCFVLAYHSDHPGNLWLIKMMFQSSQALPNSFEPAPCWLSCFHA